MTARKNPKWSVGGLSKSESAGKPDALQTLREFFALA